MNQTIDVEFTPGWESPTESGNEPGYIYRSGENCRDLARDAVPERCRAARRYENGRLHKAAARAQRWMAGSLLFFTWACVLALLVGAG